MFWAGLIIVCLLMLALFFAVTIAGGRAHDRQNMESSKNAGGATPAGAGTTGMKHDLMRAPAAGSSIEPGGRAVSTEVRRPIPVDPGPKAD
jgi:hypothetical protein